MFVSCVFTWFSRFLFILLCLIRLIDVYWCFCDFSLPNYVGCNRFSTIFIVVTYHFKPNRKLYQPNFKSDWCIMPSVEFPWRLYRRFFYIVRKLCVELHLTCCDIALILPAAGLLLSLQHWVIMHILLWCFLSAVVPFTAHQFLVWLRYQ